MEMNKIKIIVVCGPTATGKSRFAVEIARELGARGTCAEIVNADSMQVYRGMDIAVAMPSEEEMAGIPHHLFGIIERQERFSVAQWLRLAREKIAEIDSRGAVPIIVGGTGLYISSLVDNIIFDEIGENREFREQMYRIADRKGNVFLLDLLREADPIAAEKLHENNLKRIVRALEVYEQSGVGVQARLQRSRAVCSPYEACVLGLDFTERETLYSRIDERAEAMLEAGLVEEARRNTALFMQGATSAQAIGHKELLPYFNSEYNLDFCIENLKRKTRNYAKRQLTWFRKNEHIQWLYMNKITDCDKILEKSINALKKFL
jgi:tRNA dimethylallyltransferase